MTDSEPTSIPALPDGPYDVEFFFDPLCPFAWQTSVWMRRVAELRGIKIGWRFVSLKFINEADTDQPASMLEAHDLGLRYHRICAAARQKLGNEMVGQLYRAWGEAYWYRSGEGDMSARFAAAVAETAPETIARSVGLDDALIAAADDSTWDVAIREETDEAFRRTGPDVGTPIITYDPPTGSSLFGPVISEVPDDETALKFYDALRTFVDFPGFAELKRTNRPPLDLPLFAN